MPIYEYVCSGCGCKFELLRSFSQAEQKAACPQCKKPAERKLSRFACFSRDADSGEPVQVGGGGCSGCGATNCSTCGL